MQKWDKYLQREEKHDKKMSTSSLYKKKFFFLHVQFGMEPKLLWSWARANEEDTFATEAPWSLKELQTAESEAKEAVESRAKICERNEGFFSI